MLIKNRREVKAARARIDAELLELVAMADALGTRAPDAVEFINDYQGAVVPEANKLRDSLRASSLGKVDACIDKLKAVTERFREVIAGVDNIEGKLQRREELLATWWECIQELSGQWNTTTMRVAAARLRTLTLIGQEYFTRGDLATAYFKYEEGTEIVNGSDNPLNCQNNHLASRGYVKTHTRERYVEAYDRVTGLLDAFEFTYDCKFHPWLRLRVRLAKVNPQAYAKLMSQIEELHEATPNAAVAAQLKHLVDQCCLADQELERIQGEAESLEAQLLDQTETVLKKIDDFQSEILDLYSKMRRERLGRQAAGRRELATIEGELQQLAAQARAYEIPSAGIAANTLNLLAKRAVEANRLSRFASDLTALGCALVIPLVVGIVVICLKILVG